MALSKITNDGVATSGLPVGSILQVVEGTYSTQISTTSTTFVTGGLSASITPTSTSNKILISTSLSVYVPSPNFTDVTLYRGATNLGGGTQNAIITGYGTANVWFQSPLMYLDSPSTTSSTTYTVYYKASAGTAYLHIDRMGGSKIYLMEIAQ